MTHPQRVFTSAAVGSMLLLAACSSDDFSDADVEHYRSAWVANSFLEREIHIAQQRLAHLCMEHAGFDKHPELPEEFTDESDLLGYVQPRPSPEEAAIVGLRDRFPLSFENEFVAVAELPSEELTPAEMELYSETLWGVEAANAIYGPGSIDVPRNDDGEALEWPGKVIIELEDGSLISWHVQGCEGEVIDRLYEGDPTEFKLQQAFATSSPMAEFNIDDRVHDADEAWGACMAEAGHPGMSKPYDVLAAVSSHRNTLQMQAIEQGQRGISDEDYAEYEQFHLDLAVVDAECAQETGVDKMHQEVFWELLAKRLSENEAEVFAYAENAQAILDRAQELLAEGTW
ncbi:hypothetical protein [Natronoglycomyces albus]|uniref:Uncharacterized protein n=1 Tax=Natronoglycomyces albus TaxID=2811108 RepID=A0A895XT61_9ACTN|nr:hypothetical protein [Natronoglycomyces albus]QSB05726.1 hypothetical protein JQS30_02010 [Natronoglycomyces albus]